MLSDIKKEPILILGNYYCGAITKATHFTLLPLVDHTFGVIVDNKRILNEGSFNMKRSYKYGPWYCNTELTICKTKK